MGRIALQKKYLEPDLSSVLQVFCNLLFSELNSAETQYCVLRGFEHLPDFTSNDIDIGLEAVDVGSVVDCIQRIAVQNGWSTVSIYQRIGFCRVILYHPEYEKTFLPIDLMSELSHRGLRYADLKTVLKCRNSFNGFFVADPASEMGISILGRCLSKRVGTIKENNRIRYQESLDKHKASCVEFLSTNVGETLAGEIVRSVENGNFRELGRLRGRLITYIWRANGTASLATGIRRSLFASLRGKLSRRGVMNVRGGLFVVLLGPDGSGKSSLANELISSVEPVFNRVKYFHGRFKIFPELGYLVRVFKRDRRKTSNLVPASRSRRSVGKLRANLNILYYGFEYFFGRIIISLGQKRNDLIIFDRYFYDYYLHPEYINASQFFIGMMRNLVPQPDIVFLVQCDSNTIFKRKQELPLNEIQRQQDLLIELANILPRTQFVSTECEIKASTSHATELLFNAMLSRSEDS